MLIFYFVTAIAMKVFKSPFTEEQMRALHLITAVKNKSDRAVSDLLANHTFDASDIHNAFKHAVDRMGNYPMIHALVTSGVALSKASQREFMLPLCDSLYTDFESVQIYVERFPHSFSGKNVKKILPLIIPITDGFYQSDSRENEVLLFFLNRLPKSAKIKPGEWLDRLSLNVLHDLSMEEMSVFLSPESIDIAMERSIKKEMLVATPYEKKMSW